MAMFFSMYDVYTYTHRKREMFKAGPRTSTDQWLPNMDSSCGAHSPVLWYNPAHWYIRINFYVTGLVTTRVSIHKAPDPTYSP